MLRQVVITSILLVELPRHLDRYVELILFRLHMHTCKFVPIYLRLVTTYIKI